jgi:hypothetical protein
MKSTKMRMLLTNDYDDLREKLKWYENYFNNPMAKGSRITPMTNLRHIATLNLNKLGMTLQEICYILKVKNHSSVIFYLQNRSLTDMSFEIENFEYIIDNAYYPVSFGSKYLWVKQVDDDIKNRKHER